MAGVSVAQLISGMDVALGEGTVNPILQLSE